MDSYEIKIERAVRVTGEDIDDIMVSALEGGIAYWCERCEVVGGYRGTYASEQISRGGTLILHDEDGGHVLTLETFLRGLRMWLELPDTSLACIDGGDHMDTDAIDAEAADCIVQLALFGEVIYG